MKQIFLKEQFNLGDLRGYRPLPFMRQCPHNTFTFSESEMYWKSHWLVELPIL